MENLSKDRSLLKPDPPCGFTGSGRVGGSLHNPLQQGTGNRGGLFGLLQSLSLWEEFVSRAPDVDTSQVSHTKIALFGPGIESPRTKHLVHRIVQVSAYCQRQKS